MKCLKISLCEGADVLVPLELLGDGGSQDATEVSNTLL